MKRNKILIITGGSVKKVDPFIEPARKLGIELVTASFYDINYSSQDPSGDYVLKVGDMDVASFDVIYVRMVGKRLEDVTLLARYAKEKGVKIVDKLYETSHLMPLSLTKSVETANLIKAKIPIPATYFGSLDSIRERAGGLLGFPYVIKSTSGKKAKEVWSPETHEALDKLIKKLEAEEKQGKRYFAQEFSKASQRVRVFVLGGKAIAAITRPTRWRKRFQNKENGEFPDGIKKALHPVPKKYSEMAIKATKAVELDISGVDLAEDDETGKIVCWEVNSAPAWGAVAKDTGLCIEEEILKFLASKCPKA